MLAKIPFRRFSVAFLDGTEILAHRQAELTGTYSLTLTRPEVDDVRVTFEADSDLNIRSQPRVFPEDFNFDGMREESMDELFDSMPEPVRESLKNQQAEQLFLRFLRGSGINPLFLADDRSLYSDDDENERARGRDEIRHPRPGLRREMESANAVVARELRITIGRVNEWLRTLTLRGQSVGSAGANSIYSNVLRQLASVPSDDAPDLTEPAAWNELFRLLEQLELSSPRFEEFELVPHFAAEEFRTLLQSVPDSRHEIAGDILNPYLTSLKARMEALEEAERTLRALLSLLNDYLVDKRFTYTPKDGLRIVTDDGTTLPIQALSSGERQLTMLLCTTLLARRDSRLFIIDEPELSLGIPWQRAILGALLELTEGTGLQFVVATHSVEIITSERQNLVRLERQATKA